MSHASDLAHVVVGFDDNRLASELFGQFDQNLAIIEKRLGIEAVARGNQLTIRGRPEACAQARLALDLLYLRLQQGHEIGPADVEGAVRMAETADEQLTLPSLEPKGRLAMAQISTRRRTIMARNPAQDAYIRAMDRAEMVFGIGPAGTGKTYLAVAYAAALIERGDVSRLILSRPAVEAGERLGFLPGDMKEKVDPYLRPLYDALYDMMPPDKVERGLTSGMIEVAPLAFMRGRTLANAVVILDEAQNTTSMQMKMFLTRLGEGSRMIITGDPTQVDLPAGQISGLAEAADLLRDVQGIVQIRFTDVDVVRHPLVGRIVRAYDSAPKTAQQLPRPPRHGERPVKAGSAPRSPSVLPITIDIMIEAGAWPAEDVLAALLARAVEASFAEGRLEAVEGSELSVVFTDDAHIRELNDAWRQKDKATNVLSFPGSPPGRGRFGPMLGDIVVAVETVRNEAEAEGISFDDHLTHLLVHGLLHLFGHDHIEDVEAERMEALETAILGRLGIADPYAERAP